MAPAFYRSFSDTFPYGSAGSEFLARNIVHVPLDQLRSELKRDRLVRAIKEYLQRGIVQRYAGLRREFQFQNS